MKSILGGVVAFVFGSEVVLGVEITTFSDPEASNVQQDGSVLPYSPSGTDLVNQGQETLLNVTSSQIPQDGFPLLGVYDGFYSNGTSTNTFFRQGFPVELTFNLEVSTAPDGYDITSIETFMGWVGATSQAQGNQTYAVEVSCVNSESFLPLATVDFKPFEDENRSNFDSQVIISEGAGMNIAAGVDAIRIVLFDPIGGTTGVVSGPGSFDGTVIREIDIHGVARTNSPYEEWQETHWQDPSTPLSAPVQDPDDDGVVNLLEFALGTSPVQRDEAHQFLEFDGEGYLQRRRKAILSGLEYQLQFSRDLSPDSWQEVEDEIIETILEDSEFETVRYSRVNGWRQEARGFVRLLVRERTVEE